MRPVPAQDDWDICVIGAGPAGSTAARLLAERGLCVALLDRAAFPRSKVCGSCLNGAAVRYLEEAGLGDLPTRIGASRLRVLNLSGYGRRASIPLAEGFAISRQSMDWALIEAAREKGVRFFAATTAMLGERREDGWEVKTRSQGGSRSMRATIVVSADGLGGSFLAGHPRYAPRIRRNSKIGLGLQVRVSGPGIEAGEIRMSLFPGGYAGMVRLESGLVDIAAAVKPSVLSGSSPISFIETVVRQELLIRDFDVVVRLRGTPPLTRRRPAVAGHRLFILGDAAAYVEPFTGEGIAWAMGGARILAPLVEEAYGHWRPELAAEWTRRLARELGPRHRFSSWAAHTLDHPALCRVLLNALDRAPGWTERTVARLNRPLAEGSL